ncbi:sigma-54-dependent Fis family transcriptional regulator [Duganella sp. BJB488]|uniref:sigma-54-dependent transcriptional regulator n=1 Tax=unclassified Duganella TaxID=2636909 RepID=UPI000E344AA4|nr:MULTISPECIES: sigma-54 dependent transcriptional regulator [unclassified Duganella]NVD74294.1 sigma-54-dependent Fis family transcriptional regulator [Duganella sp. BJB1802]RFP15454.1 sigma-54-dependent Fis family transcriptional regulator [Duganella sp. BJB489]RFP20011.1 sigma-54-dependent Fis family transcriptional regulator [Duganella sp. BJB488]RFP38399.1 sigma-54-dependent Fis family transcriptional regulator [Duganella sp. BJB480]
MKVLLIEDDPTVRAGSAQALDLAGIEVQAFHTAEQALPLITPGFDGVVVSDVRLPGMSGLDFMAAVKAIDAQLPVVLVTGHGDITMAVGAMRDGAYDFIAKPYSSEQLTDVVQRAMETRRLVLEVAALRHRIEHGEGIEATLLGDSAAIRDLRRLILDLADEPADVLIYGETGTGKEMVARCLHQFSRRHQSNFVALNCGAIPETIFESEVFGHESGAFTGAAKRQVGKIEHADGGSLFLDEIESLPMALQVKMLRVLQERYVERLGSNSPVPVDVRVIAAAKVDLKEWSDQQKFRSDLYYRLNLIVLNLPPLRERREDIPLLFEHFLLGAAARYKRSAPPVPGPLMQALMAHDWPGNVRELRNIAERFVLGLSSGADGLLSARSLAPLPLAEQVGCFERAVIEQELRRASGSVTEVSVALGVPKQTLYYKMQKYALTPDDYK